MQDRILEYLQRPAYKPVKPAALARRLKVPKSQLPDFEAALQRLKDAGRLRETRKGVIRPLAAPDLLVGVVRRSGGGAGTFLPNEPPANLPTGTVSISTRDMSGAHTGDEVLVRLLSRRRAGGQRCGRVEEILERATSTFVGTYSERAGQGYVQIDGTAFREPLHVGDPGAKGAKTDDKVVIEMLRFPTAIRAGEAVLTEVLGPRGETGIDTVSIIREFGLPHEFSEEVLREARRVTSKFDPDNLAGRTDLTAETIVTIDPADARDFDDAISLRRSRDRHWHLGVHIADVAHFVRSGSRLDDEAQKRGTSVYLPDRVVPMLPELISNGLASLQQGKVRYTKTVLVEFSPGGIPLNVEFQNSAIKVARRFAYEEVLPIVQDPQRHASKVPAKIRELLSRMHELAMILRKRRQDAGAIELDLPEVELEFDADGRVTGAHETAHDDSHRIIEEFMLAANVAVATELAERGLPFMRRVHGDPAERKLRAFAEFVEALGLPLKKYQSRKALQDIIRKAKGKPTEHAVNYALLRSFKQAEYSAADLGHYALAADDYCHFTSPIRRYPDLTLHRLFDGLVKGRKRPRETDATVVERLAKHCSFTERRAADAERVLTRVKLLTFMSTRIGEELEAVITGVESFGIFCRGVELPVEGLLHITALDSNDYFDYDRGTMSLTGRRRGRTYRLGDRLRVEVARVDVHRRELDFRPARGPSRTRPGKKSAGPATSPGNDVAKTGADSQRSAKGRRRMRPGDPGARKRRRRRKR
ncbi:MAG: ribonuclease R [Planctomycetaceae bacterium]